MFDCSKCLSRCKADCCHGPIPIPAETLQKHKTIRPILHQEDVGGGYVAVVSTYQDGTQIKLVCPFLGLDNRCSIYDDRPFVCKDFGTEIVPFMQCSWQDKVGNVRSRSARRRIKRDHIKRRYQK